ncbi:CidA/LrgA family protein [Paenibacillus nasutitermitis]|uniref:Holin-like protein CidA n=1 Tax=Paenibacillus nasutitermitis TaxID=1652958 RepID=A0A917E0K5_9BACL|nr:CidA/LrgA family protein [Paenibacillus nasutitermitis]GGD89520.1 holin-like protein CidA [Paenibacillus nasutitermitis]
MRTLLPLTLQILFFILIARLADHLVIWFHLPVPGSIVGIALLFALLKLGIVRLRWIERGSKWLLAEMLLFFIPATVGIMNYTSLIAHSGLIITATIAFSTVAVMLCSGLVGQWVSGRKEKGIS